MPASANITKNQSIEFACLFIGNGHLTVIINEIMPANPHSTWHRV